ncbi:hypothetical protein ABW20_dc0101655 [Dactylellina cionopaga]|nr:hypothetical protein ABW20_dc0101655 [Dactylellina cionopaga]
MRSSFEANTDSEITQIALWQAYQRQFANYTNHGPRPQNLLQANDFIKNVSVAFPSARPQMIPGESGQPNRFVINGIAPRDEPMGLDFEVYLRCEWNIPKESASGTAEATTPMKPCGQFFPNATLLFNHIRDNHTFLKKGDAPTEQICQWRDCIRFPAPGTTEKVLFYKHLLCHMPIKRKEPGVRNHRGSIIPGESNKLGAATSSKKQPDTIKQHVNNINYTIEVPADPRQDESVGIPMMAAKVLLNLSTVQTQPGIDHVAQIKMALFEKLAVNRNRLMAKTLTDILNNIGEHMLKKEDSVLEEMVVDDYDDE